MDKNQGALDTIISKTGRVNDTCAHLGTCIKNGKCSIKRFGIIGCKDYKMAMTLQYLVDEAKPKKIKVTSISKEYGSYQCDCPNCGNFISVNCKPLSIKYCDACGQKIDWSEAVEEKQEGW